MRNYFKKSWMTVVLVVCVSLLMVFATYAEDGTTTTEEISILSDGSVVLTVPDITQYRTVGDFEAPPAPAGYEGYIFSGWYTAQTCTKKTALADTVTSENIGENISAYAKFVPKEILGVRAQVTAGTQYFDGDGKANIRFVTSVDSGNYLKVGFDCVQNGNSMHGESDTVYKKLEFINQSGKIMNYTPHNVFHDMSKYFMAATLEGVLNEDFGNGIVVTPYWITLDGTKVSGETAVKTVNMGYMSSMNEVTTSKITTFDRISADYYVQGGCTDGTYYYEAQSNSKEDGEIGNGEVYIYKYDLEGNQQKKSNALELHHANDLTYNPDLSFATQSDEQQGLLVVVHAKPAGTRLSFVDPNNLTIVSPKQITDLEGNFMNWADYIVVENDYIDFAAATTISGEVAGIYSLNYSSTHKKYVAGILGGQKFTFLEADLTETGTVFSPTTQSKGYTTQGNTCDDGYVYFVLHRNTGDLKFDNHIITVYDWSGNFVTILHIPTSSISTSNYEPENISIYDNTMYITANYDPFLQNQAILYKVKGVSYDNQSVVAQIEKDGTTEEYYTLEDAMMCAVANDTITITAPNVTVGAQMEMISENVTLTNAAGVDVTITRKESHKGAVINNSAKNFTIKSNTTGSLTFNGAETVQGSAWIVNSVDGELNVKDITVQNVKSNQNGGAVYVKSGTVTIERSVFQFNTADRGAAIYAVDGEQLTIKDSEFSSNISEAQGGAIYLATPTNIDKCTFNQNETQKNNGGAISIASSLNNVEDVVISNSTFDGNKAVAEGTDGYGEGSSINLPTGAGLTLVDCQFSNGKTREDNTISTDGYGDIRVANNNKSNGGGLNISGQMKCNVYLNGQSHLIVDDSLTENSEVVVNWRTNSFGTNTYSTFDGITYKNEDVMNASKEYISLSKNKTDCYLLENVKTTGTLVRRVKVADKADLQLAIDTIGATTEHTGYVEITEDIEINSPVTIPEGANVTIIDDGKTSADVTTLYRGEGLALENMFTIESGETLTFQSKGQFVIDGRRLSEINMSVDESVGCNSAVFNNDGGVLKLTGITIQNVRRNDSYGSVIRTTGSAGQVTITNSTFKDTLANKNTGAIRLNDGKMTITNSTFTNNKGTTGGVIFANGGTQLTIQNSNFTNNGTTVSNGDSATTNGTHGGAIVSRISTTITDSDFIGNHANSSGGAIIVQNKSLSVSGGIFADNTAGASGGAIYVEPRDDADITSISIENAEFKNNEAKSGGAINAINDGELTISKTTFEANISNGLGGALYIGIPLNANNCTFSQNQSLSDNGGAISVSGDMSDPEQAMISNSAFTGNKTVAEGSSINLPTDAGLTLVDCRFSDGQTKEDPAEATTGTKVGYGDIRVANNTEAGGLKISGKMNCSVYLNMESHLIVGDSLTENSQVVIKWNDTTFDSNTRSTLEGVKYSSKDVLNASKDFISLSENKSEHYLINNVNTTGTVVRRVKVADEAGLQAAITIIGATDKKIGYVEVTENFEINSNVAIPADVNVTIIDDGKTSTDVTTLYRGSGLETAHMFTINNGAKLTIQGKGKFIIDGRTQYEASEKYSIDKVTGRQSSILNNDKGTLNLENITIQYARKKSGYGAVVIANGPTTIKDSTIANNSSDAETGVIRLNNSASSMNIINSTFENNKGTYGGVIFANAGSELIVQNSMFRSNKAIAVKDGANDGLGGAIVTRIATTITGCTFETNTTTKNGGAIMIQKGSTDIEDCIFNSNEAATSGGAICIMPQSASVTISSVSVTDSTFTGNTAESTGGAICSLPNGTAVAKTITVNGGSKFTSNSSKTHGGAVFVNGASTLNVISAIFNQNTSTKHGAAICVNNNSNAVITLQECQFNTNKAGGNGGAMFAGNNQWSATDCTYASETDDTIYSTYEPAE